MPTLALPSLDAAREILARAIADSPADRTEISWSEAVHRRERSGRPDGKAEAPRKEAGRDARRPVPSRAEPGPVRELNLFVRVVEKGRTGVYRAAALDRAELATAIRRALADARLAPSPPHPPELPPKGAPAEPVPAEALWDAEIADLTAEEARELLSQGLADDESATFAWTEGRVGYAATGMPPRVASLTGAALALRIGRGPATGSAEGAARRLSTLAPGRLLDLARARRADPALADPPAGPVPLVLAPLAAAQLATAFARAALDSRAIAERIAGGEPKAWPLFGRLGEPVAASRLTLLDDATDREGLPLPFDARGAWTRRIELISGGLFRGAALSRDLAERLDLPASLAELPLAADFDRYAPSHLALVASDPASALAEESLFAQADGGLMIAALSPLAVYDPGGLRFRAVAHGVRRIDGGTIGPALPNLVWEGSLLEVLAHLSGIGAERVAVVDLDRGTPWLGATLAPAIGLEPLFTLRPA